LSIWVLMTVVNDCLLSCRLAYCYSCSDGSSCLSTLPVGSVTLISHAQHTLLRGQQRLWFLSLLCSCRSFSFVVCIFILTRLVTLLSVLTFMCLLYCKLLLSFVKLCLITGLWWRRRWWWWCSASTIDVVDPPTWWLTPSNHGFSVVTIWLWTALLLDVTSAPSLSSFQWQLKTYFFSDPMVLTSRRTVSLMLRQQFQLTVFHGLE